MKKKQQPTLPKNIKDTTTLLKEVREDFIHWKHAKFGKKPEETPQDVLYRQRLNLLVDQYQLVMDQWTASDAFFRESNRFMT